MIWHLPRYILRITTNAILAAILVGIIVAALELAGCDLYRGSRSLTLDQPGSIELVR